MFSSSSGQDTNSRLASVFANDAAPAAFGLQLAAAPPKPVPGSLLARLLTQCETGPEVIARRTVLSGSLLPERGPTVDFNRRACNLLKKRKHPSAGEQGGGMGGDGGSSGFPPVPFKQPKLFELSEVASTLSQRHRIIESSGEAKQSAPLCCFTPEADLSTVGQDFGMLMSVDHGGEGIVGGEGIGQALMSRRGGTFMPLQMYDSSVTPADGDTIKPTALVRFYLLFYFFT